MQRSKSRQRRRAALSQLGPSEISRLGQLRARRAEILKELARLDLQIKGLDKDVPQQPKVWQPD